MAPALTNYKLCNSYAGAVGTGRTQSFSCGTTGRYVVVQLKGRTYLTMCEVEVYGSPAKGNIFMSTLYTPLIEYISIGIGKQFSQFLNISKLFKIK